MVAGGKGRGGYLASVELYNVANGIKAIQCGCIENS